MKTVLRTLVAASMSLCTTTGFGQSCVPDTVLYTSPGIYPDSATGIPPATELVPYSIVITMIVPADTLIDFGGGPTLVIIDSIVLVEIVNKPAWLNYDCEPPSCGFPGDSASCTLFHGTPPAGSAGLDTVDIIINQHGNLSGFPVAVPDTLYDFYVIRVVDPAGVKEIQGKDLGFGTIPMPFSRGDLVAIKSTRHQTVRMSLFDVTGRAIYSWNHEAAPGTTFTSLPVTEHLPGAYLLGMNSGGSWVSRTMIVQ